MTLIKFIEYQTRDHFLKKIPLELKLTVFFGTILMAIINNNFCLIASLSILIVETILLGIATRDVSYILEIYVAYIALFVVIYIPSILLGNFSWRMLVRLAYIYSIAFTSTFVFASTDISQLETFMRRLRMPENFIIAVTLAWNFLPSTYAELNQIILTQKARGLDLKSSLRRLFYGLVILIPFLMISLLRLRTLTDALRARGSD